MNGCRRKEPDFFSESVDWRSHLVEYEALFAQKPGTIAFEASPSYTFYPMRNLRIWDNLYEYNPDLKLIYIVRHPVDRAVSAYMHMYERGYTSLPLDAALTKEASIVQISRYYTQIIPYVRRFGRDRVLLLDFDDLTSRRDETLAVVAAFPRYRRRQFNPSTRHAANVAQGRTKKHHRFDNPSLPLRAVRRLSPTLWRRITDNSARRFESRPIVGNEHRRMLLQLLDLEIRALEELMQRSFEHWRL